MGILTWNHLFDVLTYMVTINTMAVTDSEKVKPEFILEIGHQNIGVLVLLCWITWNVSDTCCKSKLRDTIKPF